MDNSGTLLKPLRFNMLITSEKWSQISPTIISYNGRLYNTLKSGWTDIFYEHLWNEMKLPCAFNFKRAKINNSPDKIFLTITGKCSECKTQINIYNLEKPTEDGLQCTVSTYDTREIAHKKKRQLRSRLRRLTAKELQAKSTYTWRRDEANRLMEYGDIEPANLFSENVLRKVKQEYRDKELGVESTDNPMLSLMLLK